MRATLACGGKRVGDRGYFIEPTVFADVKNDMTIAREEIFGPLMSVIPFEELAEVITSSQVPGVSWASVDCSNTPR